MQSLGINFPFTETNKGGIFGYTEIDIDAIKANLTSFLTLKKGHRVMNNSLYSPLYNYIMEIWDELSEASLISELKQKLIEFFPEIEVKNIKFVFDEDAHLLHLTLYYTIIDLKVEDNVSIDLVIQS
jgi:phage baseplate assembly protein W